MLFERTYYFVIFSLASLFPYSPIFTSLTQHSSFNPQTHPHSQTKLAGLFVFPSLNIFYQIILKLDNLVIILLPSPPTFTNLVQTFGFYLFLLLTKVNHIDYQCKLKNLIFLKLFFHIIRHTPTFTSLTQHSSFNPQTHPHSQTKLAVLRVLPSLNFFFYQIILKLDNLVIILLPSPPTFTNLI